MNKLIGATLLAGLLVLAQLGVRAQVSDHVTLLNVRNMSAEPAAVRAERDFLQRAGDKKDEQWYKAKLGYEAEYAEGPVKGLYWYDKNGHWVYSVLTYNEDKMPEDVRRLVRSTYYDFSIGWVKEINEAQNLVYVVHIEDKTSWKNVAVQDGEMRVLQEFSK